MFTGDHGLENVDKVISFLVNLKKASLSSMTMPILERFALIFSGRNGRRL